MTSPVDAADVLIVGLGPAGIGTLHGLVEDRTPSRIVCVEAGSSGPPSSSCSTPLDASECTDDCPVVSGLGGSTRLYGGKLSWYPAGSSFINYVGNQAEVERYLSRALQLLESRAAVTPDPHSRETREKGAAHYHALGFEFKAYDVYLGAPSEIRRALEFVFETAVATGRVAAYFATRLEAVTYDGTTFLARCRQGGRQLQFAAQRLVLTLGRAGYATMSSISAQLGLGAVHRTLEAGVRLDFPTRAAPLLTRHHRDLKLKLGNARTYCTCAPGRVVTYSLNGQIAVVEGTLTGELDTGRSNFGIVVRIDAGIPDGCLEDPLSVLINPSHNAERPHCTDLASIAARSSDSLSSGPYGYYRSEVADAVVRNLMAFAPALLTERIQWNEVDVWGPEIGGLSPELPPKDHFRSRCPNCYVAGESTGQFRGTLQALASGLATADAIKQDSAPHG